MRNTTGIGKVFRHQRQHDLDDTWIHGRRSVVIQVDHFAPSMIEATVRSRLPQYARECVA